MRRRDFEDDLPKDHAAWPLMADEREAITHTGSDVRRDRLECCAFVGRPERTPRVRAARHEEEDHSPEHEEHSHTDADEGSVQVRTRMLCAGEDPGGVAMGILIAPRRVLATVDLIR
jgi:hypothetical protein